MAIAVTKEFDSNDFAQTPRDGDMTFATYFVAFSGNYPAGGEPISFAADFHQVVGVAFVGYGASGGGPWNGAFYVPFYERATGTTGSLMLAVTGAAQQAQLEELAAGAYASEFAVRLVVMGRPITDAV